MFSLQILEFSQNFGKLLWEKQIYDFEQRREGNIAHTFILERDHQRIVLKLTGRISPEVRVLPHLQKSLSPEFQKKIPQLLNSGTCLVNWTKYDPGKIQKYDLHENEYFFVELSYLPGQTLSQLHLKGDFSQNPVFTNFRIRRILTSLASIIQEINDLYVYHKDIRGDNIVIQGNEGYLIDFGNAMLLDPQQDSELFKYDDSFKRNELQSLIGGSLFHLAKSKIRSRIHRDPLSDFDDLPPDQIRGQFDALVYKYF